MPEWIVPLPNRLDVFLASQEEVLSRAKAQKEIEAGNVMVNDATVTKVAARLQEGDKVALESASSVSSASTIAPEDLHLQILYEDNECFVINKPEGIAVHPGAGMGPGEKTILSGIAFLFEKRSLPFSSEAVLVHRLDKGTTGCLLIAKNAKSHRELQTQFESRTVTKQYIALVAGVPEHKSATVDAPIGRHMGDRTTMSVFHVSNTREAKTTYNVLTTSQQHDCALLLCDLHTGRTHQIRVHLSSIGHPVLGDGTYTNILSERLTEEYDIRTLCLHAWKLKFHSPADQKEHEITAPLSQTFLDVLRKVGVEWEPV